MDHPVLISQHRCTWQAEQSWACIWVWENEPGQIGVFKLRNCSILNWKYKIIHIFLLALLSVTISNLTIFSPSVQKPGGCPYLNDSQQCGVSCRTDADCLADDKCCSHNCGYACVPPVIDGSNIGTVSVSVTAAPERPTPPQPSGGDFLTYQFECRMSRSHKWEWDPLIHVFYLVGRICSTNWRG